MNSPKIAVDWTIPAWGVVLAIAQLGAVIWWGAGINARVAALESDQVRNSDLPVTIARMDERGKSNADILRRLETKLDALETKR